MATVLSAMVRDALGVCHVGDCRKVDDVPGRIRPDRLAEDGLGVIVDQLGDRFRAVVAREAHLDTEPRKHVREVGDVAPYSWGTETKLSPAPTMLRTDIDTAAEPELTAIAPVPASSAAMRRSRTSTVGLLMRL